MPGRERAEPRARANRSTAAPATSEQTPTETHRIAHQQALSAAGGGPREADIAGELQGRSESRTTVEPSLPQPAQGVEAPLLVTPQNGFVADVEAKRRASITSSASTATSRMPRLRP